MTTEAEVEADITALRNRFRVMHGAETDFEAEFCTGSVLFAGILAFHLQETEDRLNVVRCFMLHCNAALQHHGTPPGRTKQLITGLSLEIREHIHRVLLEWTEAKGAKQ